MLLAVCSADYRFLYVDIGQYGGNSDGGIFKDCELFKRMERGQLRLPDPEPLPGADNGELMPFFLVGDDAFPLRFDLMKPFAVRLRSLGARRGLDEQELVFNYRVKRGRLTIECTFGILTSRFRIYHRKIFAEPKNADRLVKATVILHNYLTKPRHRRIVPWSGQKEDEVRFPPQVKPFYKASGTNASNRAKETQAQLMRWFNGIGAVSFQRRGAGLE